MSEIEEAAAAPLRRRHEAPAVVQSAELGLHPVRPDGEIHSMLLKIRLGKALIKCKPLFFYVQHQQLPKLHLYLLYGLYPPPYFSMMINSIGESIPDSSLHNAVAVLYEPPLRLLPRLPGGAQRWVLHAAAADRAGPRTEARAAGQGADEAPCARWTQRLSEAR